MRTGVQDVQIDVDKRDVEEICTISHHMHRMEPTPDEIESSIETHALPLSLTNSTMCSTGCAEASDCAPTHFCRECDKVFCVVCATRHTKSHFLTEISVLFEEQRNLEEKLDSTKKTKLELAQRNKAREEEHEREKHKLSAQFCAEEEERRRKLAEEEAELAKEEELMRQLEQLTAERKAEEERRLRELEQCAKRKAEEENRLWELREEASNRKAAMLQLEQDVAERKVQEEKRMQELEDEAERLKAVSEEEARLKNAEEVEIIFEQRKLQQALARVQVAMTPRAGMLKTREPTPRYAPPFTVPRFQDLSREVVFVDRPGNPATPLPNLMSSLASNLEVPLSGGEDSGMCSAPLELCTSDTAVVPPQTTTRSLNVITPTALQNTTIEDWLSSISLQQYTAGFKEYGYDSLDALDTALEDDLDMMMNDSAVDMKLPHRRLLIDKWRKRVASKGAGR